MNKIILACLGSLSALALAGCGGEPGAVSGQTFSSPSVPLGQGKVHLYARLDGNGHPQSIGLKFTEAALRGLPTAASDGQRCLDLNGDGRTDLHMECVGGHETVLRLPEEARARLGTPIHYATLNYNAHGHQPAGVYDRPHFDFHFYAQPDEERRGIRLGRCGELMDCDDFATATKDLAPEYAPPGYANVGAAAGMMGNHLIDPQGPEFQGQPFTHTWIWGTYDGRISFFEPMITVAYLQTRPRAECVDLRMPQRFHESGSYPTRSCLTFDPGRQEYDVSLERFEFFGD